MAQSQPPQGIQPSALPPRPQPAPVPPDSWTAYFRWLGLSPGQEGSIRQSPLASEIAWVKETYYDQWGPGDLKSLQARSVLWSRLGNPASVEGQINKLREQIKVVPSYVRDPTTNKLLEVQKMVYKTLDQERREKYRRSGHLTQRGHAFENELPILAYVSAKGKVVYLSVAQRQACMEGRLPSAPTCPSPPFFRQLPRVL